jgi:hypothetical protein
VVTNPNWPVIETGWGPYWDANGGAVPPDRYTEVRTIGTFTAGRGRQYALDQVQAGTSSMTLPNPDGSLDPDNAAGPFAGRIRPFQPIRRRAQWPPTVNLLTQVQATGGDVGGYPLGAISTADTGPRILTETDTTGGAFVASGTAWQGGTVAQFAVPATATATQWICYTAQPAVRPGETYSVQLRVRNVTAGTTVSVAAAFRTRTATDTAATAAAGTTAALVGSATAAWSQITLTATAAAASASLAVGVQVVTAPGAAAQVQVDGWQLEKAAAPTAWVLPGTWYPLASHFVEKWPAAWQSGGTYGVVRPSGVDALALLSQQTLPDPLTAEIQSHTPRFLFQLTDPAAADWTGNYPPAPIARSKFGPGVVAFGTDITATDPVGGIFTGAPGPVLRLTNASPATNVQAPASFLALDAIGIRGPANPAGPWTRIIAFRFAGPATRSVRSTLWSCFDGQRPVVGSNLEFSIDENGHFCVDIGGPNPASGAVLSNTTVTADDGNWHLAMVVYDDALDKITVRVDNIVFTFSAIAANGRIPTGLVSDCVGTYVDRTNGGGTTYNWAGDLSFAAEFPVALSATDRGNLYTAWKAACAGESTEARYARILRYAGYTGPSSIDTGQTTSMGPADFADLDAVSALQAVVDTEGGAHWVDAAGTITFRARTARYNQLTPQFTFGERGDLGEWPYEDCQPDFDSTHLGGIVQVTQAVTGQVFTAVDAASVKAYFPRTIPRTVNSANPLECQDAANYLKSRYAQPSTRVAALKLHPSAVPALWPVCLSLEQGTRIRVMRRPLGAPPITIECFVEKLDWTQDDGGEAVLIVQASRADTLTYGRFAAWHTTLNSAKPAGTLNMVVKPGQDNTNPLATQIASGQLITFEPGTANEETLTVDHVGATSPGWTFATLVMTTPTAFAHATGTVVCEALPAGVTDPTTWDPVSAFDTVAFAY